FKSKIRLCYVGIIGQFAGVDERKKIAKIEATLFSDNLFYFRFIGKKFRKIHVGNIPVNSITDKDVFVSIVIKIKYQCAPAPICCCNPGIPAYFTKLAVPIIQ